MPIKDKICAFPSCHNLGQTIGRSRRRRKWCRYHCTRAGRAERLQYVQMLQEQTQ